MPRRASHLLAALALGLGGAAWTGCGDDDESGGATPPREEIYDDARQRIKQGKQEIREKATAAKEQAEQARAEGEKARQKRKGR